MAEILPINREDDGQTQLQEKNGVVSAVPQPTYPAINIPDVITQDFFNQPPSAYRQRIENDLQQRRQEYLASFQPTAQEEQLGKEVLGLEEQITNLRQREEKGAFNIQQQRIAMPLITGQEAALRRQGQLDRGDVLAQLENKQRSYGYEVEKRKGLIERGKAMLGFAESDLDRITKIEQNNQDMQLRILHYTQGLKEKSRQVFGTIIKLLEGKRFSELSPEGQLEIQKMASQAGLPLNAIITGLDVQADAKKVEKLQNDMDNSALKSEDLGDKIGFFDKSGKMVSSYTKGIAPKAGGVEDDDDKLLSVSEAESLGVPYGTTVGEAITSKGETPDGKIPLNQKETQKLNKELIGTDAYKAIRKGQDSLQYLLEFEKAFKKFGLETLPGKDKGELSTKYQTSLLNLKEFFNLGVLNGPDLEVLQWIMPDPTKSISWGPWGLIPGSKKLAGVKSKVGAGIQSLKENISKTLDDRYESISTQYGNYSEEDLTSLKDLGRIYIQQKASLDPKINQLMKENPNLTQDEIIQI